ncbi:MAG: thioredoxin family protein [Planctomycetota bacterium]|jgi:glutaredoxin
MSDKRQIEIFTAGCAVCDEAVTLVRSIVCPSCEIEILDMHEAAVADKAKQYGIRSVPAVVVDGQLADCCAGRGPDEASLRAAGIGTPK